MFMNKLKGALRSTTIWVNGVLLAILSFAGEIVAAAQFYMPELAQYLPADIYRWLGVAIVVFNMYQRTRTKKSLAEKGKGE